MVEDREALIGMSIEGRRPAVLDRKTVRKFFGGGVRMSAGTTVAGAGRVILRYPAECTAQVLGLPQFATCRGLHVVPTDALAKVSARFRDYVPRILSKGNEALVGCAGDRTQLAAFLQVGGNHHLTRIHDLNDLTRRITKLAY